MLLVHLNSEDRSHLLSQSMEKIKQLDELRNENTFAIINELKELAVNEK